jgi:hypothetical protein
MLLLADRELRVSEADKQSIKVVPDYVDSQAILKILTLNNFFYVVFSFKNIIFLVFWSENKISDFTEK